MQTECMDLAGTEYELREGLNRRWEMTKRKGMGKSSHSKDGWRGRGCDQAEMETIASPRSKRFRKKTHRRSLRIQADDEITNELDELAESDEDERADED